MTATAYQHPGDVLLGRGSDAPRVLFAGQCSSIYRCSPSKPGSRKFYTEVFGVRSYEQTLDHIDAPLNVLASLYGVPYLQLPISAGAMFSFFALALSCMNAGARMIFAMGRHGFFHRATCKAHELNETPHISLGIMATLMFCIVTLFWFLHFEVLDEFNDAGTMGAFGFLAAYVLITLAAPANLRKRKELRIRDIVLCVSALALLLIPAVDSIYPVPAFPLNLFPYIFLGYLSYRHCSSIEFSLPTS